MNVLKNLLPSFVLLTVLSGILASCENFNPTEPGDKYYYYPSKNVYYDVKRSNFFYSLDNGQTWDSMYSENPEPAIFGPRESVYSTKGQIYKENDMHRRLYEGTVLNIINEESLKVPEKPVIEDTPEPVAVNTEDEPQKKEKKRPLKNFFQKIFRKKD